MMILQHILLIMVIFYVMPLIITKYNKSLTSFSTNFKSSLPKHVKSFEQYDQSEHSEDFEDSEDSEQYEPVFVRYIKHSITHRPRFMIIRDHEYTTKIKSTNIVSTSLIVRTIGHLVRYKIKYTVTKSTVPKSIVPKSIVAKPIVTTNMITIKLDNISLIFTSSVNHSNKIENSLMNMVNIDYSLNNTHNKFSVWLIIHYINNCNSQNITYIINITNMIINKMNEHTSNFKTLSDKLYALNILNIKAAENIIMNDRRFLPTCDRWIMYLLFVSCSDTI